EQPIRQAGSLPLPAPAIHRHRAWPGWFRRRRAPGSHHDSSAALGSPVSFDFWSRHRRRNDPDYGRYFPAVYVCGRALCLDESRPDHCFRPAEPGLRPLHFLPDWVRRWPLHQPSQLDPALIDSRYIVISDFRSVFGPPPGNPNHCHSEARSLFERVEEPAFPSEPSEKQVPRFARDDKTKETGKLRREVSLGPERFRVSSAVSVKIAKNYD